MVNLLWKFLKGQTFGLHKKVYPFHCKEIQSLQIPVNEFLNII